MRSLSRSLLALGAPTIAACAHPAPRSAPGPLSASPPIAVTEATAAAPVDARADAVARLRVDIDSMVADPQFANAHWGILVVDPVRHDTLYAHNAGKLFLPASNQKIITGSVALALLGPEYRWRTTFAARGPIANGSLHGDLVVVGRGDPTVSDHMRGDALAPMRDVADSLASRGVKRISGRLIADGNAFPGPTLGFGWDWDDADFGYGAGVDELLFNEGYTRVVVRGGAVAGAPATAFTAPSASYPPLRVEVRTVDASDAARRRVDERPDSATGGYVLTGGIAPNDSTTLELAYADPTRSYLTALREALASRGITVGGAAPATAAAPNGRERASAATATTDTLFSTLSPTLREVLPVLEKPSQNQIAEIFLRTLGYARTGIGSADSGRRVVEGQLRAWGVQPERDVAYRDGSGLSRHDYVTPGALVRVLSAIRGDTAFRAFYDALPIAGVDGTIRNRMKGTLAEGNVHAKTGTVDKARSLSGYVTTADGRQLVFSFLCNNYTVPTRNVERVQDAIATRLAALGVSRATGTR